MASPEFPYHRHNDLPVLFADFGLTPAMRKWCEARGQVADVKVECGFGWFKKPFALLASPFARSLWLDADCEVRGNLSRLVEFAKVPLALTAINGNGPVWPSRNLPDEPRYSSGMMAVPHGSETVVDWALECLRDMGSFHRGDQDALSRVILLRGETPILMPDRDHWGRFHEPDPGGLVVHWWGRHREKLRERISASEVQPPLPPAVPLTSLGEASCKS